MREELRQTIDIANMDPYTVTLAHIILYAMFNEMAFTSAAEFYTCVENFFHQVGPLVDGNNLEHPLSFNYIFRNCDNGTKSMSVILYNYHQFLLNPHGWHFISFSEMNHLHGCTFSRNPPGINIPWLYGALPDVSPVMPTLLALLQAWIRSDLKDSI